MGTATEDAIAEQQAQLDKFAPKLDGLRRWASIDTLTPQEREVVQQKIAEFERRIGVLTAAVASNKAVMDDGHPDIDVREVEGVVYRGMVAAKANMDDAFAMFSSNDPTTAADFAVTKRPKTA